MENKEHEEKKEIRSTVLERLNEAIRTAFAMRGVQLKSDMARELGYKNPYFSGVINGKEKLTHAFLMNLRSKLKLNIFWILKGEGKMFMEEEKKPARTYMVPLVPVSAYAGSLTQFSQQVMLHECELIASPIRGVDMAVTVSGESMSPEYPNGSIVLIKKINASRFIEWGRVYVLDTVNGLVIKILVPSDKENAVRCLSINPNPIYAPFDVDGEDIINVYAVKCCMTRK